MQDHQLSSGLEEASVSNSIKRYVVADNYVSTEEAWVIVSSDGIVEKFDEAAMRASSSPFARCFTALVDHVRAQGRAEMHVVLPPPAQQSQLADAFMFVTPEQLERHALTAWECPPLSRVVLVSSLKRLHSKNTASLPSAPEQIEQQSIWVDQVMDQAQVFASAWSLVGGQFDSGDGLEKAEEERERLRALILSGVEGGKDA